MIEALRPGTDGNGDPLRIKLLSTEMHKVAVVAVAVVVVVVVVVVIL